MISKEQESDSGSDASSDRSAALWSVLTLAWWKNWFTRPCGGWEVLRLSAPIVVSSGALALMNFADRLFLTWYDQTGMAAAFQAGTLLWALTTFPTAITAFTNAFVSQYNGAGQYRRIGDVVWQGVFLGLLAGLLFVVGTPLVAPIFRTLGATGEMLRLEEEYWFYISLGASAMIANEPFTSYFCGRRDMKTVMCVGLAAVALNTLLDPLLIFGIHGRACFGVKGAAIASAISLWFKFFLSLTLAWRRDKKWECGLRQGMKLHPGEMRRLLRYGSMNAFQVTAENACFSFFILLMNVYGEIPSAAAAIAFNMDFLVYFPAVGLGIATTSIVGNQTGANRRDLAERAVYTTALIATVWTGLFVVAFLSAPNFFLDFFAARDPERFETIRATAIYSLQMVTFFLFFDTLNVVFTSALRGAGDARFIMRVTTIVAAVSMLALGIGTYGCHFGYKWPWACVSAYMSINATVFIARFRQGGWKKHSLVEPELPALDA